MDDDRERQQERLEQLERLFAAIEEELARLPAGGDRKEAIRAAGRRVGIPTSEMFISDYLTAEAGGDVRFDGVDPPPH